MKDRRCKLLCQMLPGILPKGRGSECLGYVNIGTMNQGATAKLLGDRFAYR